MTKFAERLAQRIHATGALTIADYMTEILHHPEHGYYSRCDPLGSAGDFITAPEITQVFGELIGLWCADAWERMGRPDPVLLAELGPGRGTLLADGLRALKVAPSFRRALRLHLVETSPVLRRLQAERLGGAAPVWHDGVATLPDGPLILIANEFLDALPVRQVVRREHGWHERGVTLAADGRSLAFALGPAPSPLAALIDPGLRDAPPGSCVELRPAALALARTLGERLIRERGYALFIDYGYFPSACGETLQALRRHHPHDVLSDPGAADVTAHVDFAAFAGAAQSAGAAVFGPVPQGRFLAALGIAERARRLIEGADQARAVEIESACARLIDPRQMGTLFKALALAHPALPPPAGFAAEKAA